MDTCNNNHNNQYLDYPSFDQPTTNNQDGSSLGLVELSLNLRNQLNSLRSIKKNFTRRFDNLLLSSDKKDVPRENSSYEQKYNELKAKYDELEEVHQNQIDETLETLRKSREGYGKKIEGLEDELAQKNNYIEIMKQGQVQTQEKVNLMEARIASLEQLNNTLTTQLKDKSKELSGLADNTSTSMTSRSRDMVLMKTDFAKIVDRVGGLEDIINNLKEGKKQDMKALEESKAEKEELKAENFQLLLENKKLKNEIEELNTKFSSLDKCLVDRRQKTDEFINTLAEYQNSFQVINQVNLDLETVFEPLKEQNRRLLADKEKLSEENRNMKIKLATMEDPKQRKMEEEVPEENKESNGEQKKQDNAANEAKSRGIDLKFYMEIMDKLKEFEKQVNAKDKENTDLQTELEEIKSRNLELETKIISINRSPTKKKSQYEQYLSVDAESHMASSPRRRKNENQFSPQNSEVTREAETDSNIKENETKKDNHETMEDEADKDARLKITRKPKQIKKPAAMSVLTGINICPNCSLIIKKADKNLKDCTKCHNYIHEKCVGEQKNGLCNPCNEKLKKSSQSHHEDEDENEEKEKPAN